MILWRFLEFCQRQSSFEAAQFEKFGENQTSQLKLILRILKRKGSSSLLFATTIIFKLEIKDNILPFDFSGGLVEAAHEKRTKTPNNSSCHGRR
jgi:hypothetical protein